ncbi:GA module-containing protein [Mycoplasma nasistruthionis]|uniref:Protein G-related albumin-binding (GA) module domain-containing protein n=1 Tax=Mycoplasma nasistruthionis TaxID=353852 RepID=A0A4Y6I709_9MOLU|nr:GA module-containing protein [Mycoplasma nasistruthionis]QDF65171.1 hypothetical protein FIV53_02645 [Mycoplasma nasistruthionis]
MKIKSKLRFLPLFGALTLASSVFIAASCNNATHKIDGAEIKPADGKNNNPKPAPVDKDATKKDVKELEEQLKAARQLAIDKVNSYQNSISQSILQREFIEKISVAKNEEQIYSTLTNLTELVDKFNELKTTLEQSKPVSVENSELENVLETNLKTSVSTAETTIADSKLVDTNKNVASILSDLDSKIQNLTTSLNSLKQNLPALKEAYAQIKDSNVLSDNVKTTLNTLLNTISSANQIQTFKDGVKDLSDKVSSLLDELNKSNTLLENSELSDLQKTNLKNDKEQVSELLTDSKLSDLINNNVLATTTNVVEKTEILTTTYNALNELVETINGAKKELETVLNQSFTETAKAQTITLLNHSANKETVLELKSTISSLNNNLAMAKTNITEAKELVAKDETESTKKDKVNQALQQLETIVENNKIKMLEDNSLSKTNSKLAEYVLKLEQALVTTIEEFEAKIRTHYQMSFVDSALEKVVNKFKEAFNNQEQQNTYNSEVQDLISLKEQIKDAINKANEIPEKPTYLSEALNSLTNVFENDKFKTLPTDNFVSDKTKIEEIIENLKSQTEKAKKEQTLAQAKKSNSTKVDELSYLSDTVKSELKNQINNLDNLASIESLVNSLSSLQAPIDQLQAEITKGQHYLSTNESKTHNKKSKVQQAVDNAIASVSSSKLNKLKDNNVNDTVSELNTLKQAIIDALALSEPVETPTEDPQQKALEQAKTESKNKIQALTYLSDSLKEKLKQKVDSMTSVGEINTYVNSLSSLETPINELKAKLTEGNTYLENNSSKEHAKKTAVKTAVDKANEYLVDSKLNKFKDDNIQGTVAELNTLKQSLTDALNQEEPQDDETEKFKTMVNNALAPSINPNLQTNYADVYNKITSASINRYNFDLFISTTNVEDAKLTLKKLELKPDNRNTLMVTYLAKKLSKYTSIYSWSYKRN